MRTGTSPLCFALLCLIPHTCPRWRRIEKPKVNVEGAPQVKTAEDMEDAAPPPPKKKGKKKKKKSKDEL
jgi:hypothetical protein